MAKRRGYRNGNNGSRQGARTPSAGAAAPAGPVYSEKAKALMAEAERISSQEDKKEYVPKPRALRRYERYSNMGN